MEKLIVGLMGVKQAGKSTVGQILAEDHGFAILEPGMQVMELLLDIDPYIIHNGYCTRVGWVYQELGYLGFKNNHEGRRLLQELGTRIRERDPYFWVNQQLSVIAANDGDIVHTSVRFPNEGRLIKEYEGQLWLIKNPRVPDHGEHESELAWRDLEPDRVIMNDGTLSDLRETVRNAIKELR